MNYGQPTPSRPHGWPGVGQGGIVNDKYIGRPHRLGDDLAGPTNTLLILGGPWTPSPYIPMLILLIYSEFMSEMALQAAIPQLAYQWEGIGHPQGV
jgi:hypothetical protein